MEKNKRSKRHRTNRNHISIKDSVMCITAFAEYARGVEKQRKVKNIPKFEE